MYRLAPVVAPASAPACGIGTGPCFAALCSPRAPRIANYKIDARLDAVKHQITATQTLTWTNSGESSVDRLPFHLYLNAFKNEASLFMRSSKGAVPAEGAWGGIQIDSIQIAGTELVGRLQKIKGVGNCFSPRV